MDLIALSGFFGAGKTTLLLQLARHFIEREGRKVYVVQNEVGQVGVDDQRLRAEGLQLEALLGGCICCTLQAMLVPTLQKIAREHRPEVVLLETSGLAQPPLLRQLLRESDLAWGRQQLWVLLDATRLARLQRALAVPFVEIAVDSADVIIFNKIDVAGETAGQHLRASVLARNPRAVVATTALRAAPDLPDLLRLLAENPPPAHPGGSPPPVHHHHDHSVDPVVCARQVVCQPPHPVEAQAPVRALAQLRDALAADGAIEIGHLKLFLEADDGSGQVWSVTRLEEAPQPAGHPRADRPVRAVTLNAIVYGPAPRLAGHVTAALETLFSP